MYLIERLLHGRANKCTIIHLVHWSLHLRPVYENRTSLLLPVCCIMDSLLMRSIFLRLLEVSER